MNHIGAMIEDPGRGSPQGTPGGQAEKELAAIAQYVRTKHRGYSPEAKLLGPKEPATILDAIRELLDEATMMADMVKKIAKAEGWGKKRRTP